MRHPQLAESARGYDAHGGDVSEKIRLREVRAPDVARFYEHQTDAAACEMAGFFVRERAAFEAHWSGILADDETTKRTVLVGDATAGFIVSFIRDGRRQVGYWLARDFWGGGVATRALGLFLETFEIRPLFGYVAKHNPASVRVLEKCGFRMHGECVAPASVRGPKVEEYVLRLD